MKYLIYSAALLAGCFATSALVGKPVADWRNQLPGSNPADDARAAEVIQTSDAPRPARINPFIYTPFDRPVHTGGPDKGELLYPKFMTLWGADSAARLQKLREMAAESAANDPRCNGDVVLAEYSESHSSLSDNRLAVFVECEAPDGAIARFLAAEGDQSVHFERAY